MSRATARLQTLLLGLYARFQAQQGQTMAEYGILVAVIAIVVVVAAVVFGSSLSSLFRNSSTKV